MRHHICKLLLVCALVNILRAQGVITTVAGTDSVFISHGVPAVQARLSGNFHFAVASDADGNVYIADPPNQAVFKVSPSGLLTTIAGNGIPSFSGDGGPARAASMIFPQA